MIHRARTALLTLALLVPLVLSPLLMAAPARATVAASEPRVSVTLTGISPQVLRPGQDLTVTATVTNDGPLPVAEPRVGVHLDASRRFVSRSSLDLWREAGTDGATGATVLTQDLPEPLAPGETREVTLTLPAGSTGLRNAPTTWGARGLAVGVVDRADPARARLGLARTFLLWFPDQPVTPTRVSVLAPVVGPPGHPLDPAWAAAVEQQTTPGGRLAELLAATGAHSVVTWALDPALVRSVAPGRGTPASQAPGGLAQVPAGPAAQAWARALTDAVSARDVMLLPYADADVAALAHNGAGPLWEEAVERSEDAARSLRLPATSGIVWPAGGLLDEVTADVVTGRTGPEDRPVAVVAPSVLPPPDRLTYTPSGRTTVTTPAGPITALVADPRLSRALTTGETIGVAQDPATDDDPDGSPGDGDPVTGGAPGPPTAPTTPATAAQDLLAELAVITRERPSDGRHVLMTVPRDWAPDADVASAQLAALSAAPWVQPTPLAALLGLPDDDVDRGTLPVRIVRPSEVNAAQLGAARRALDTRARLAQMIPEPEMLMAGADEELLSLTSVAWRSEPARRAEALEATVARTEALRDAVHAPAGSTLNVISTNVELPVRVANDLDQPVTITVALRPGDARLIAEEERTVTVPAGAEELVQIPVHGIQSADVPVTVVLSTTDGTVIDDSTVLDVRVRAEWEGIGTAVLAALLALGLVTGLIRSIRRGRTGRRAAPWTGSGPDTLSPEEQALARSGAGPAAERQAERHSTSDVPR